MVKGSMAIQPPKVADCCVRPVYCTRFLYADSQAVKFIGLALWHLIERHRYAKDVSVGGNPMLMLMLCMYV